MDDSHSHPEKPAILMNGVTVGSLKDLRLAVLEDVDWTVNPGDYWVVAGMQGSGKSDFMFMTAGLTPPQKGFYELLGWQMPIYEGDLLAERLRVGLVFDGGQLFHQLTVRENIALPLRYHKELGWQETERRVNTLLALTGLEEVADNTPGSLGRNIHKRVGLARALILQPEILLLDNPLSGLDLRQANWWLGFLTELSAGHSFYEGRRVTLVATGEDLRPWQERASHFAILQNKKFVTLGDRSQLAGHSNPLVKELLAAQTPGIN